MNYLINTTILMLLSVTIALGQKSEEIVITGKYEWFETPEKKTIAFSFSENGKTCGPNAEFETIGEQFAYLKFELLKNNDMAKKIKESFSITDLQSPYPKQSYFYEYKSMEEAKLLHDMAKEAFAENLKLYHHFKQDDKQILLEAREGALDDAIQRAEHIAGTLGYQNIELLSIDAAIGVSRSVYPKTPRKVIVNFETTKSKRTLHLDVTFKMN